MTERELPRWFGGAVGAILLLGVWYVLAVTVLAGKHVLPTPFAVVKTVFDDPGFDLWPALGTTAGEAGLGFLWGNAVAIVLALAFVQVPLFEKAFMRIVLATYCMPLIAIGPILQIILNGTAPKIALSALAVVFTTLVGALVGLRSADPVSMDVVRAYGGGSFAQLRKVRIHAALPATFAGLAISGPSAVLGAIIGEYLGAQQGIGIAIINSEQSLDDQRVWALAVIVTVLAGASYLAISLVGHRLTAWAPQRGAR